VSGLGIVTTHVTEGYRVHTGAGMMGETVDSKGSDKGP
jgi:hypothetical protein